LRRSLVIGKFWPPHAGHFALIEHAFSIADRVYVLVCSTPTAVPEGHRRALWIQEAFPSAEVILTDDFCSWHASLPCPPRCTPLWADRTGELIPDPIDYFVASEDYGPDFATAIGAKFVEFDRRRLSHPVSGTAVRIDPAGHWHDLPEQVRTGLVRKVTIFGAESTGTTTLANNLAAALGVTCIPEVGRTVSWELMAEHGSMSAIEWTPDVFWRILDAQSSLEERARRTRSAGPFGEFGPWLVADTDALATVTWWRRYVGEPPESLVKFASARLADLYVITSPDDVPFEQDGIRDGEDVRFAMHGEFLESVVSTGKPHIVATGTPEERLAATLRKIQQTCAAQPLFSP